jgi:ATP-dependent RNA helicase DDX56/DBP9
LRSLLADSPDIVIATPARASVNLNSSALSLEHLAHLVIDEADLVLSYGYDNDLQNVAKIMPKGVQTILMSATLTSEVETLKGLFCRNPAVLELEEAEGDGEGVSQYVMKYVPHPAGYVVMLIKIQMCGRREISAGIRHIQAETYQGKMYHIRERH